MKVRECGTPQESKMCRTDPAPNRADLGFPDAVLTAFDFLTKAYDFHLETLTPTFVRYESPRVFVNIYHGRSSFELGFEGGLRSNDPGKEEIAFSLGDIIDLRRTKDGTLYARPQASTAQSVRSLVPKLADLVRTYADPVLRGDPEIFTQLAWIQTKKSDELLNEWRLRELREKGRIGVAEM